MRVALDAGPLILTSGGLQRYVSELTVAMSQTFPADEFVLMSDQPFTMPKGAAANATAGATPQNWLERRWWMWGAERLCERKRVEIFHGTNFAVPYRSRRATVLTLHDLSPWMDRAWHAGADRVRQRSPGLIRHHATMVITPSEAVRKQAIAHFGIATDRVVAVPHAASAHFRPASHAPGEPYFLFVGTLEPRKNLPMLLEARRQVSDVRLLIAGRQRPDFPPPAPEPGVEWLGEVPESRLPELYSGALAVIYPSLYEGFGLPVLEAMQCGACVITSRDPAIREVTGDAALHTSGVEEMAAAMRSVAADPDRLGSFRKKAVQRTACFSWERTARETRRVYEEAVARFARP